MSFEGDPATDGIISAIISVHRKLGPGFLESVYRRALVYELRKRGHRVDEEYDVTVYYDTEPVGVHRLDLFVDERVVVELKAVEKLIGVHYAQTRSYMKAVGTDIGLLVNFSGTKADYRRVE